MPYGQLTSMRVLWHEECQATLACVSSSATILLSEDGSLLTRVDLARGSMLWQRAVTHVTAAVESPSGDDGGRLALGSRSGKLHIWRYVCLHTPHTPRTPRTPCALLNSLRLRARVSTGSAATAEPLLDFCICAMPQTLENSDTSNVDLWVEMLCWSADGHMLGAAAGRQAVVFDIGAGTNQLSGRAVARASAPRIIQGIAFASSDALAYATYGGVGILRVCWPESLGNMCDAWKSTKGMAAVTAVTAPVDSDKLRTTHLSPALESSCVPGAFPFLAKQPDGPGLEFSIGAAAVLSVAISPDGHCALASCCTLLHEANSAKGLTCRSFTATPHRSSSGLS